ncbi:MAG: hypothetical protein V1702_00730 [Candidatus Woesearchaeota archaeon]
MISSTCPHIQNCPALKTGEYIGKILEGLTSGLEGSTSGSIHPSIPPLNSALDALVALCCLPPSAAPKWMKRNQEGLPEIQYVSCPTYQFLENHNKQAP